MAVGQPRGNSLGCPAAMPPNAARCHEKWDGLGPWVWKTDPGRPCASCRFLSDSGLFDPITERAYHRDNKCTWAPPEVGAEELDAPRSSARTAPAPPFLGWQHDSSVSPPPPVYSPPPTALRSRATGKRWEGGAAAAATPRLAAERLVTSDIADLPYDKYFEFKQFPWYDQQHVGGPLLQLALAEQLSAPATKHVPTQALYDTGELALRWTINELGLHGKGGLEKFRSRLKGKGGAVLAAVRKARDVLRVPEESELAVELFLVNLRSGWLANRKMEPCLKKPEQELVYKSAQSQLVNALEEYRAQPTEGRDPAAWVADVTKGFHQQRVRPGGIGEARKYLLREMMATAPSLGHRKLSTLMYLANLHCAVAMGREEGHKPDESEMRLVAEAAQAMTVSPSTFRDIPMHFHAHTVETLKERLGYMDAVFVLNDHGHRGGVDRLVTQFAGFSSALGRPIVVTVDNGVVGKTGKSTAETVKHHVEQLSVNLRGTMTDSASSAIDTQARQLSAMLGGQ